MIGVYSVLLSTSITNYPEPRNAVPLSMLRAALKDARWAFEDGHLDHILHQDVLIMIGRPDEMLASLAAFIGMRDGYIMQPGESVNVPDHVHEEKFQDVQDVPSEEPMTEAEWAPSVSLHGDTFLREGQPMVVTGYTRLGITRGNTRLPIGLVGQYTSTTRGDRVFADGAYWEIDSPTAHHTWAKEDSDAAATEAT